MPRAKKQQTVYCIEHDFNLIPLRPDLYFKHNVYASFCSGKAIQVEKSRSKKIKMKEQKDESKSCLKCPVYNRDRNPGTNAFILAEEQKDYLESFDDLLRDHNQKVNNFKLTLDQKSVLMIPKPKTKYSYCNVCRCNYEEYLIHIRSEPHKANVHKSVFTRYIKEYQLKYQKERTKLIAQKKPLYWSGQPTQPSLDDDVIEIKHSVPRKRVKLEMQAGYEAKQQRYDSIPQNPCPISAIPIKSFQQNMGYNLPVSFHYPPIYPLTPYQQLRYTQAFSRNLLNQHITQNIVTNYLQNIQTQNMINNPQFYYPQFLNPQQNTFQQAFPNNLIDFNPALNCHSTLKASDKLIRKQKQNHPEIIDLDSSNED